MNADQKKAILERSGKIIEQIEALLDAANQRHKYLVSGALDLDCGLPHGVVIIGETCSGPMDSHCDIAQCFIIGEGFLEKR